jgi:hypothetical protein
MRDDDPWNLVLYNDSEDGPSVTQFADNPGQGGAGFPSPPANSGSVPDLSSLLQTGLGSGVIAGLMPQLQSGSATANFSPPSGSGSPINLAAWNDTGLGSGTLPILLPQRQDTSAALLSPAALSPSQPLQDPTPFELPEMTMDQVALASGMSPEQVADIGNQAKMGAVMQVGMKNFLGPVAELALPELGVPEIAAQIVGHAIDLTNHISEPSDEQYIQDAPDKAVFKYLNDSEIQSIPSNAKAWLP